MLVGSLISGFYSKQERAAKLAFNIVWTYPERYSKVFVHLGSFHTMSAYMGALGTMMSGSGFEDIVVQSGICASGSIMQVMNGKHYNRAMRVHQQMMDAIDRLLEVFLEQSTTDVNHLPEVALLAEENNRSNYLEAQNSASFKQFKTEFQNFTDDIRRGGLEKTAQFWIQYRDCVADLLTFMQAVKENDFHLYIQSIHQLCSLLFSADRQNYARYLPLYYVQLTSLPSAAEAMMHNNGFSVSRSKVPCCRIPVQGWSI